MKLFRRLSTVFLVSKVYTLVKVLTMVYVEKVNLAIIHYYSMATAVLLLCCCKSFSGSSKSEMSLGKTRNLHDYLNVLEMRFEHIRGRQNVEKLGWVRPAVWWA